MDKKIKRLEKELLELKTAQEYQSVAMAGHITTNLGAGQHTIVYADGDSIPLTFIYVTGLTLFNVSNTTTPVNNIQHFTLTAARSVQIISTRKILSVT